MKELKVLFFDYPGIYERFKSEFDMIFQDVCSRGAFIMQRDLEEFESELSEYINAKHVLGVADGTNAIYMGLKALDIGKGDEVIISPHTYVATANAIEMVGATVIFADIDENKLLCPVAASKKITDRTKAIMPTQLNGRCANMAPLIELCKSNGLYLTEDSAQGLGAKYLGQAAGTFGAFGTLSFYPAKLIGCFGDGGAVITNDEELGQKFRAMRDHGRDSNGRVSMWGTNSRLDNLQAAFLRLRLRHFSEDIAHRRNVAQMYCDGLKSVPGIDLPSPPDDSSVNFDVYQNFECGFDRRDDLKAFLAERGIGTLIQWGGDPVHHFEALGFDVDSFTDLIKVDRFFERCLMLPIHMSLTEEQVIFVVNTVREFYGLEEYV